MVPSVPSFAASRRDRVHPKAITATIHKLARPIYRLLKYGEAYVAQGMADYEQAYRKQLFLFL